MAKWTDGNPDIPVNMDWSEFPEKSESCVFDEVAPGTFVWAAIFPGCIWRVYETSLSSHSVLQSGGLLTKSKARAAAEEFAEIHTRGRNGPVKNSRRRAASRG